MNKIPLKQAIATGVWLECHAKYYTEDLYFRLRVTGFTQTSVDEIDPKQVNKILVEGILWLLSIEVVNLTKAPIEGWKICYVVKIVDQDGYEFRSCDTGELALRNPGLLRFSGWSSNPPLSPKMKASGSIAFDLPDEETNYYLAVKDGNIREA